MVVEDEGRGGSYLLFLMLMEHFFQTLRYVKWMVLIGILSLSDGHGFRACIENIRGQVLMSLPSYSNVEGTRGRAMELV